MANRNIIPAVARAAVVEKGGAPAMIKQLPVPMHEDLKPGQCLIHMQFTGVCHSDLSIARDIYGAGAAWPLVGGHEGVGYIVAIARDTETTLKIGDTVGVKYIADACLNCEACLRGFECICFEGSKKSGNSVPGTFQDYTVSYTRYVTPIPSNLPMEMAAPLLCAGVTVLRALKDCKINPGDWVAVPGAGGGLGHLAVQYAIALGYRVIAIDTGEQKKKLCLSYGAEWLDFKETVDIVESIKQKCDGRGTHAAIVSAASSTAYQQAVQYLRNTGVLAIVGLPPNASVNLPILETALSCKRVIGCFVGSRQDANDALQLAASGRVNVNYSIDKLENLEDIYARMEKGQISGRVVLDLRSSNEKSQISN